MVRLENESQVLRGIMGERNIVRERGQSMHVSRNNEERSCKPLLWWKSNEYYIYLACVALGMQHAMRMRHVFACGQYGCKIFFHVIS